MLDLIEAGLIEVTAGQARGIRPAGIRARADLLRVPVLGRVAADAPIGADAELVDTLTIDRELFSRTPDYLLRVQGNSMIEDGILDGDLVGVHRTSDAHNGQTIVAWLDGELTIKRFDRSERRFACCRATPLIGRSGSARIRISPSKASTAGWFGGGDGCVFRSEVCA